MNIKTKFFWFLILMTSLELGCSKESTESDNLAQILIGEWEIIETVDVILFGDTLWHQVSPQTKLLFEKDSTIIFDYGNFQEFGTYYAIENDTINFMAPHYFKWVVLDFDESLLTISKGVGREGEFKDKFSKVN